MKTFRNSRSDIVFDAGVYLVMILGGLIVLYPLYFMVIASFSDPVYTNSGQVILFPKGATFDGYAEVFKDARLLSGYINTILYSIGYMIFSVVLTVLAAYPRYPTASWWAGASSTCCSSSPCISAAVLSPPISSSKTSGS